MQRFLALVSGKEDNVHFIHLALNVLNELLLNAQFCTYFHYFLIFRLENSLINVSIQDRVKVLRAWLVCCLVLIQLIKPSHWQLTLLTTEINSPKACKVWSKDANRWRGDALVRLESYIANANMYWNLKVIRTLQTWLQSCVPPRLICKYKKNKVRTTSVFFFSTRILFTFQPIDCCSYCGLGIHRRRHKQCMTLSKGQTCDLKKSSLKQIQKRLQ